MDIKYYTGISKGINYKDSYCKSMYNVACIHLSRKENMTLSDAMVELRDYLPTLGLAGELQLTNGNIVGELRRGSSGDYLVKISTVN